VARKTEVTLVDDIDGGAAEETLSFTLDGATYQIDVSSKRADELRATLWPFINKARRMGRDGARLRSTGAGTPTRNHRAQNKAIRDWARGKKIDLSDRGRIPHRIVEQYQADQGR
jgi:hypothetical protein